MVLLARIPGPDYAALADILSQLPTLMRDARGTMSTGGQARQVGISATSLSRLGPTSSIQTAARCLAWLATR